LKPGVGKKELIVIFLACVTFFSGALPAAGQYAPSSEIWYSVQAASFPLERQEAGYELIEKLLHQGRVVYAYRARIGDIWWMRVRIGVFANPGDAAEFRAFLIDKGFEGAFVTKAPVHVENTDKEELITTPGGIWLRRGVCTSELFAFDSGKLHTAGLIEETRALAAPCGGRAVFYYDGGLHLVNLETGQTSILLEGPRAPELYRSTPRWSPCSTWIGFMDFRAFEYTTGLWIIKPDGSAPKQVVDNRSTDRAVKSFHWHPDKPLLLFVEGYAFGTVSIGGALHLADTAGTVETLVDPGQGVEVHPDFYIDQGAIHYKLIQFSDDYTSFELLPKQVPLPEKVNVQ
jgi:hypothetical protein